MTEENQVSVPPMTELQARHKKLEEAQIALAERLGGGQRKKYVRFFVAALSSIPWVGGLFGAASSFTAEQDQERTNDLHRLWLAEHEAKAGQLIATLMDIFQRLDNFGDEIQERIESPEFLALVRKTFRSWDEASTQEKKQMLQKLITNAGAIRLCSDDLVRLFIAWIALYDELHFSVIREIYRDPGIKSAVQNWYKIYSQLNHFSAANMKIPEVTMSRNRELDIVQDPQAPAAFPVCSAARGKDPASVRLEPEEHS